MLPHDPSVTPPDKLGQSHDTNNPRPDTSPKHPPSRPYDRLWQSVLDPRSLQWLMMAGGGILVVGLVIWLAVIGVFDNPLYAALGLGIANELLLVAGVATAIKTRYAIAGRAVAMLACLLLPLNLWFYDAQGLITLKEGGHLWLPALVCCVIYTLVARLLRDSLFVYPTVLGVAMTGLLFLADAQVERLWEVIMPSTLLVTFGAACVHVERLFPRREQQRECQAFTRDDFGLAFFRAGHVLLASGLMVLLGGRLAGRFYDTFFADYHWFTMPDVATVQSVKLAALGLAAVGAYTYVYSQLVVSTGRRFALSALLTLVWCGVISIDLLGIHLTEQLAVGILAVLATACHVTQRRWITTQTWHASSDGVPNANTRNSAAAYDVMWPSVSTTATLASHAALAMSLFQLLRGMLQIDGPLAFQFSWEFSVASGLVVAAYAMHAWFRCDAGNEPPLTAIGLAVTVFVGGVAGLLPAVDHGGFAAHTAMLTIVPLASSVLALSSAKRLRNSALRVAEATGTLVSGIALFVLFAPATAAAVVLFALLAVIYAIDATVSSRRAPAILATVMATIGSLEAVAVYDLGAYIPLLVITLCGLGAMLVHQFRPLPNADFAGRVAVVLGGVGGGLLAANRLLASEATLTLLMFLICQIAIVVIASWLASVDRGRHGLMIIAGFDSLLALATLNSISILSLPQRLEVLSTVAGVAVLIAAHIAWRRETTSEGKRTDVGKMVDLNLWSGSLLASIPLTLGLIDCRLFGGTESWLAMHNVGTLAIGLMLLGSGVLCRFRATTLSGGGMLLVYLCSLLALIRLPDQLKNVAVYLMLGGGLLFGAALLLSVYRERLMSLPGRMRDGEGVFAVLKWR